MPFFANQSREQLRQMYVEAWRKHCARQPLQPLEAQIADVISAHPEYQSLLSDEPEALTTDWRPEDGATNPFLHMGLHLAVRDQVATDRPVGIRKTFRLLAGKATSSHDAEHRLIECLAEALWQAQRSGLPPDEAAYLDKIRGAAGS